jgi:hypothetical protein
VVGFHSGKAVRSAVRRASMSCAVGAVVVMVSDLP